MTSTLASKLAVYAASDRALEAAQKFACTHGLAFATTDQTNDSGAEPLDPSFVHWDGTPYVLCYQGGSVAILHAGKGAPGPVSASFLSARLEHRRKFGGGKSQMIAKAVGLGNGVLPAVLDATAGLGRDAFVLASLGCKVQMLERSPIVAELLRVALAEAQHTEISSIMARMRLLETDATRWLVSQADAVADVIYLDPMYPQREKTALVKKEMRLFSELLEADQSQAELSDADLLAAALAKAAYRVVVKRPRKGDAIAGPRPSFELTGKSCRYDIYALKNMAELKRCASL